ncbi:MAG: right-handed parallel beta-helix repeat-containing protein, partial [Pseudomonadota bacterium]
MANFVVDTLSDVVDANDGVTSLREVLSIANSNGEADQITFAAGLSGGTLTLGGLELTSSEDLTIDGDITGDGVADITLDGNNASRVLLVNGGTTTLESLTIQNGYSNGSYGGNLYANINAAGLTLIDSTVTGGYARASLGGGYGGGISAYLSDLTIIRSTVSDNRAQNAGGIDFYGSNIGTLTILDSTISGNVATGRDGGLLVNGGDGTITNTTIANNVGAEQSGGLAIVSGTDVTVTNATITANFGGATGGVRIDQAALTLQNSIVSGNAGGTEDDLSTGGTLTGGNIVGDEIFANGTLTGTTTIDQVFAQTVDVLDEQDADTGVDGGLLADNGGLVQTVALVPEGAAIDLGDPGLLDPGVVTDARGPGFDRNAGGLGVDLGAFEEQTFDLPPEIFGTTAISISEDGAT